MKTLQEKEYNYSDVLLYKVRENKSQSNVGNNEHIPYVDYAMKNYKEWEPSKGAKEKITEEKMKEFEKWYDKF